MFAPEQDRWTDRWTDRQSEQRGRADKATPRLTASVSFSVSFSVSISSFVIVIVVAGAVPSPRCPRCHPTLLAATLLFPPPPSTLLQFLNLSFIRFYLPVAYRLPLNLHLLLLENPFLSETRQFLGRWQWPRRQSALVLLQRQRDRRFNALLETLSSLIPVLLYPSPTKDLARSRSPVPDMTTITSTSAKSRFCLLQMKSWLWIDRFTCPEKIFVQTTSWTMDQVGTWTSFSDNFAATLPKPFATSAIRHPSLLSLPLGLFLPVLTVCVMRPLLAADISCITMSKLKRCLRMSRSQCLSVSATTVPAS